VRSKIRYLERLTVLATPEEEALDSVEKRGQKSGSGKGNQKKGPLTSNHIKEALKRFEDHVGILEDHRASTQGSDIWHFSLNLWHSKLDIVGNLYEFDKVWEANRPTKSKEVAGSIPMIAPPTAIQPVTVDTVKLSLAQDKGWRSWGDVPDVSSFYGRQAELATLQTWVKEDRCRLITLIGMGGIGKTALSVTLAQQLAAQTNRQGNEFECVIWRSLRNAPQMPSLLNDLLLTLSQQQRSDVPNDLNNSIIDLLEALKKHRCLLVLDNFESVLEAGQAKGAYRSGYEDYGYLLRSLSDSAHQSCLLLTSREKPIGLSAKEGPRSPIRSYQLKGVGPPVAQGIVQAQGISLAQDTGGDLGSQLIDCYDGNPLAIKIAIATTQDLFGGDIAAFLAEETIVFGDIADLLSQQINRLSALELSVMQWLAISREPVSLVSLREKMMPAVETKSLLAALTALQRRSLIECDGAASPAKNRQNKTFTQQPVVMEYITEQVIEQCCELFGADSVDRLSPTNNILNTLALMEADAKDYIRQSQQRVVVRAIALKVRERLGSQTAIRQRCDHLLKLLHKDPTPGYGAGNLINLMHEWQLDVTGYDFSHLTIWQVYLPELSLPETNFMGADLSRSVFSQTLGGFLAIAYHPKGHQLATAISNDVVVWDIQRSKQLFMGQGHTAWIMCLAYSPDGKLIASGSRDESLRLWDAETGQCLKTLHFAGSWVQSVTFSPDGHCLVIGGNDAVVRIWDIAAERYQQTLKGHRDRILSLKFSADGQTLVSGSQDKTIRVWDFDSGQCSHTWEIPLNWTLAMDLSPEGTTLVTGSEGKSVKFWNMVTGKCLHTLPNYQSQVWSVTFSPDGNKILTASEDKTIKLWDVNTGECLKTLLGHTHSVWLAHFSPDGESLVSASNDQRVKIWAVASGQCLKTISAYSNWVQSVAFSPDGQFLVSGGEDRLIRIWQVESGACVRSLSGHTNQVSAVAFSPDGNLIASSSDDETIRLWNPKLGDCLRILRGHTGWVQSVAFSPKNRNRRRVLASGSHDKTVRLWDLTSGECLQTLEGHLQRIKAVAFNAEGSLIASASDDHTIKLWEVDSGVCVYTLEGHRDWVLAVGFHPVQPWVVSGGGDRLIKIWDIETGNCIHTLEGHTHRIRSVTFSPDGQGLVSGGDDTTVRLWDVKTSQCQQVLTGHTRSVWSVAFSADGLSLASCSEDETIRRWEVNTGTGLGVLRPQRPYEKMNITDVVGLTAAQRNTLKALGAIEGAIETKGDYHE